MTYRWLVLLFAALFLVACGGGGGTVISTIEVTPSPASRQVGQTQQFTAVAKDANGSPIAGVTFTWTSSNSSVATVNSSGLATAVSAGTATITASAGGKSGTATFTVTNPPPTISTIEVTPPTASRQVGQTQQFTAVAKDANGSPIAGVTFTWTSSNSNVATVNSNGLATAVSAGTATITASAGGKSGTATFNVTPVPTFTVGGTVSYLNGTGLVLAISSQTKTISANGSFTFDTPLPNGTYPVSVQTQPSNPAQTCTVSPSTVTISGANVTNLVVECSPYTQWLASTGTDKGTAITTDAAGNVIVAGLSREVLGDDLGQLNTRFPDVVVAKYDPNGERLWVKQFTVGDPDTTPNVESSAKGVATDSEGNIYVVGSAYVASSNAFKGFVLKLGPNGNKIASIKLDESTLNVENGLNAVAVEGSNLYVGGYTAGTVPSGTNVGGEDAALYKFDTSLNPVWARQFGSSASDQITALGVDASGNVYIAGFAAGALPTNTPQAQGETDAFAAKYSASGNQDWLNQFGTPFGDSASALAVSGSDVYVAGYVTEEFESGFSYNGGTDLFVVKFSGSSGVETWRKQFSPTDPAQINPYGMAADASGNVYIVGDVNVPIDGSETHQGGKDVFVLQYLANGTKGWNRQVGSPQDEIALAVTLRGSDLYITGHTAGAFDDYTNKGGPEEIFVLKYDITGNKK